MQTDPEGNIILGGGSTELAFAWIANNDQNTVSKYDTRPFTLGDGGVDRSCVRWGATTRPFPIDGRPKPDGGIGYPNGLRGNDGNNPSRTAVDLFGDVWVANRAANIQGSVTKIANSKAFCEERNGIPGIQTSEDKNNDGIISTNPADGEMIIPSTDNASANWTDPSKYDECILFSTPVGPPGTGTIKARAMAISEGIEGSAGDVWVGVHNDHVDHQAGSDHGPAGAGEQRRAAEDPPGRSAPTARPSTASSGCGWCPRAWAGRGWRSSTRSRAP